VRSSARSWMVRRPSGLGGGGGGGGGGGLEETPWSVNAQLPGAWLRHHSGIDTSLITQLDRLVDSGNSSMRGVDRMLRLSWTLADLDGAPRPTCEHIVTAQQLRNGADQYE